MSRADLGPKFKMETVNISRGMSVCNTFHFFFAAAKASLLPFLTIFLRLLGLSATETGIIMAAKTLTGFVWAPIWSRCAIAYNKRRTVLMLSLFVMAATYLSLSVLFTRVKDQKSLCFPVAGYNATRNATSGRKYPGEDMNKLVQFSTSSFKTTTTITSPVATTAASISTTVQNLVTGTNTVPSEKPQKSDASNEPKTTGSSSPKDAMATLLRKMFKEAGYPIKVLRQYKPEKMFEVLDSNYPDTGMTFEKFLDLWPKVINSTDELESSRSRMMKRDIHDYWLTVKKKMLRLLSKIQEEKMELFLIALIVIIIGEFICSPIEKVADDAWYDFLDKVDDLEKYGNQRLSGSIAYTLLPVVVSLAVNYSQCLLPYNINHFMIHFYIFGAFIGLAFIAAAFYPVPPSSKQKIRSKVMRGLRIICCDCRGFLYVITLLTMGVTYASVHNFLFWLIQDTGGTEINMGMCVSVSAFVEIPMLALSGKMVNKIGNSGVIVVSLLAMCVRTLYYSFLQIPWTVLPAEVTHAFTHTAMWYAVLSYEDFNIGPAVDRSIRSVLSSVYFGIGFAVGSLLSGIIYDLFGSSVLYWSGSALTGIWAIVFGSISLCLPKKEKIRYVRLLREDTDDSDIDPDDWLEMALKDQ